MPSSPAISPRGRKNSSARFVFDVDNQIDEEESEEMASPSLRMRTQSAIHRHSTFSLKREEFKDLEDEQLIKDFAFWISAAGERYVSERNFVNDLSDGVALCTILTKVPGSGVVTFHKVAPPGGAKALENFTFFRRGCSRLSLPVSFGLDELRNEHNPDVICTLIFLAHVCHSQGVATEAMEGCLLEKVDDINDAIDDAFGPMKIESTAQTIEESLLDMRQSMSASAKALLKDYEVEEEEEPDPWYQSVAKYLLSIQELREALKRSRQDNVNAMMERTISFKNSLPPSMRTRLESITGGLLARADSLPEMIKSRLPFETAKRLACEGD